MTTTDHRALAPKEGFDFDFRPATYWPESATREMLLSRIQGRVRQDLARQALRDGGLRALHAFLAREDLPEADRAEWGRLHPWCMGGEYLPRLRGAEVEIARISLKSTTFDLLSVRARPGNGFIRVYVVDEYGMTFRPTHRQVRRPLSLRELIEFIESTNYLDDEFPYGLVWNSNQFNYVNSDMAPEEVGRFTTVRSAFYPELGPYYVAVADRWVAAERAARGFDEEEGEAH